LDSSNIIARRKMLMFERILVPVDGSEYATRAVGVAAELAKHHGSSVFLLHVIRDLALPKEIMAMIEAGEVTASRMQILQDSADIILTNAKEEFERAGISRITRECLLGDPPSKILEYAEENGIDLIVLGHRGLGPTRGFLGGVARKLVNVTTISVLIAV
jgi:nucleotide-binding universal stress UspA family protein